jgi:hypothetical protein
MVPTGLLSLTMARPTKIATLQKEGVWTKDVSFLAALLFTVHLSAVRVLLEGLACRKLMGSA